MNDAKKLGDICEYCGGPLLAGCCDTCAAAEAEGREFAERTNLDERMKEHERLWMEATTKSDAGA
jgi:hypothetical protein